MINSRSTRWVGYVVRIGVVRNAYKILVGIPGGKRPLGISKCRWEYNVRMDLGVVVERCGLDSSGSR
jgi:hypothetical protein